MDNITLLLGNRGYKLSIAQGVGSGSLKDHHVEVALLNSVGFFVNTGYWWFDTKQAKINDDPFDDVVSHINADDLQKVIVKATAWVNQKEKTYANMQGE
tara:strand:- start:237 stop:533 length:297 start_codon:yes stop_codon:yes gene_type:complete